LNYEQINFLKDKKILIKGKRSMCQQVDVVRAIPAASATFGS